MSFALKSTPTKPVTRRAEPASPSCPPPALTAAPYREQLAAWDDVWRLAWGIRANELEAAGVPWREAEEQAFREIAGGEAS